MDDRRIPPDGWHRASSVTEAIRLLATWSFEEVSLDHDICHEKEGAPCGYEWTEGYKIACSENFSAVAYFITQLPVQVQEELKVVIHTTNESGAKNMQAILGRVGINASWVPALHD